MQCTFASYSGGQARRPVLLAVTYLQLAGFGGGVGQHQGGDYQQAGDVRRSRLVVARDPIGIKPLYYSAEKESWFVFASEVRALLQSRLLDSRIDRRSLAGYLAYGAVQEPLTIYEGVYSLPRGCWQERDDH